MAAAAQTGHNMTLPDAICVVVLFFLAFFCISKVMLRQSAYLSDGLLWLMSQPFLKNQQFRRQRISVCRFSCCGTLTYSHERMAKKKARIVSCEFVHCCSVSCCLAILAMTQTGMAFCCFSFGSLFLKARNSRCKMKLSCRSLSLVGLGRPFSQNVKDTSEMVFRIVPEARVS